MINTDKNPLILIADNDLEVVETISKFLYRNNFRVLSSFSSVQAIGLVYKKKPDIIIINIVMQGMESKTFYNLLKVNSETKDIPVLFICNETNSCDGFEGEGLSYEDIILKPIEKSQNEFMNKHKKRDRNDLSFCVY